MKYKKKVCCRCMTDISQSPSHHYLCYSCWKQNNTFKYNRPVYALHNDRKESKEENGDHNDYNNNYNCDYDYDINKSTLRDALENDEYAFYNLYGEFPSESDW